MFRKWNPLRRCAILMLMWMVILGELCLAKSLSPCIGDASDSIAQPRLQLQRTTGAIESLAQPRVQLRGTTGVTESPFTSHFNVHASTTLPIELRSTITQGNRSTDESILAVECRSFTYEKGQYLQLNDACENDLHGLEAQGSRFPNFEETGSSLWNITSTDHHYSSEYGTFLKVVIAFCLMTVLRFLIVRPPVKSKMQLVLISSKHGQRLRKTREKSREKKAKRTGWTVRCDGLHGTQQRTYERKKILADLVRMVSSKHGQRSRKKREKCREKEAKRTGWTVRCDALHGTQQRTYKRKRTLADLVRMVVLILRVIGILCGVATNIGVKDLGFCNFCCDGTELSVAVVKKMLLSKIKHLVSGHQMRMCAEAKNLSADACVGGRKRNANRTEISAVCANHSLF